MIAPDHLIRDEATLEALYGEASAGAIAKEIDYIHPHYRAMIEASPFMVLCTSGPGGLDSSPRGDSAGFVHVLDDRTLLVPDRRGNNRADSLRNIVRDSRVGMLFLIPGWRNALRVNGRARLENGAARTAAFTVDGNAPRCVIVITIVAVFFQCGRAIERAGLWNPAAFAAPDTLPTPGDILSQLSDGALGGKDYDRS